MSSTQEPSELSGQALSRLLIEINTAINKAIRVQDGATVKESKKKVRKEADTGLTSASETSSVLTTKQSSIKVSDSPLTKPTVEGLPIELPDGGFTPVNQHQTPAPAMEGPKRLEVKELKSLKQDRVEELEQELKERDAEIVSLKGQVARAEGKVVLLAISMEGTYRTCSWLQDNLSQSLQGLDYFVEQLQQKPLGTTAEEEQVKHAIFVMSEYEDQKTETMAPLLEARASLEAAFPALGSRMFCHNGDVRTRNAEMQEWIERKTTPGGKLEYLYYWAIDQHGELVSD